MDKIVKPKRMRRNLKTINFNKSVNTKYLKSNLTTDTKEIVAYVSMTQKYKKSRQIDMALRTMCLARKIMDNSISKLKKNDMKYLEETL